MAKAQDSFQIAVDHIINGNCIDVLQSFPENCVDLIFADPPYNLQLQNELLRPNQTVVDGVGDEWDQFSGPAEYDEFTRAWLGACRRVLKDEGTLWVIGSYHNIFRVGAALMDLGYWILNDVIWRKTNPMPNFRGTRFTNATETLIWAQKHPGAKYTFNYHTMKNLNEDKQMPSVWEIPICRGAERITINGKKAHSTQKPEALLYRVILSSSSPGDLVLDPFFGSGTTGAVAKRLKRHYIGIEANPAYVEIARARIAAIPEPVSGDEAFVTESKRALPRVSFGRLLEAGYIRVGQKLFSRAREHVAIVKADSHVICGGFTGSIHKAAAHLQGVSAFNGWEFWYYEDAQGHLASIDRLRDAYRAGQGLG